MDEQREVPKTPLPLREAVRGARPTPIELEKARAQAEALRRREPPPVGGVRG